MTCFLMPHVVVVYIHVPGDAIHEMHAKRFVESYHMNPPGETHQTVIVSQNSKPKSSTMALFNTLPDLEVIQHDDSGWDIGGFQLAARKFPCDLMVFFGGSTYIKCEGWLTRMVESFLEHGDTLYGSTGSMGDHRFNIFPHIRTTGFWISPSLFNRYPRRIQEKGSHGQRYEFEHGRTGLTTWAMGLGKKVWVIAKSGDFPFPAWNSVPNGFHKGDQSNVLVGDRLTSPPYYAHP